MDSAHVNLCIVGPGLIGGSVAMALAAANQNDRCTALVRSESSAAAARESGLFAQVSTDPAELIPDAELVLLTVPMLAMREQLQRLRPLLRDDAIVTDAGSVKGSFVDDAQAVFGSLRRIVPGHPIAGRERSGLAAADARLYVNRRVLLTPLPETESDAIDVVRALWERCGALVETLAVEHHDRVLANTSHLPHMLAYALVDTLAFKETAEEIFRYAAGGFRDFSRTASSDPVMWRDISLCNREAIISALDDFDRHLLQLRDAIARGDGEAIESIFARAKAARDNHFE